MWNIPSDCDAVKLVATWRHPDSRDLWRQHVVICSRKFWNCDVLPIVFSSTEKDEKENMRAQYSLCCMNECNRGMDRKHCFHKKKMQRLKGPQSKRSFFFFFLSLCVTSKRESWKSSINLTFYFHRCILRTKEVWRDSNLGECICAQCKGASSVVLEWLAFIFTCTKTLTNSSQQLLLAKKAIIGERKRVPQWLLQPNSRQTQLDKLGCGVVNTGRQEWRWVEAKTAPGFPKKVFIPLNPSV